MAFINPTLTKSSFLSRKSSQVCNHRPRSAFAVTRMNAAVDVPDVLKNILERKKDEVSNLRAEIDAQGDDHPVAKMLAKKGSINRLKNFHSALDLPNGTLTVIAEIKRRSPSKGEIADIKDPGLVSRVYHEGGAGAISVLTDLEGFGGTMDDLRTVVKTQARFKQNYPGPCPVLRKDFVIDEIQIAEAAASGASAVLLIVAALGKDRTKELLDAAHAFGLDALVEVHDEQEVQIALDVGAEIIGINNRNLRTFEVSLENSFKLGSLIPESKVKIAESGIEECLDVWKLRDAGFSAVLVGEALVKAFEQSTTDSTSYTVGYNQAKGLIKAFKSKGSVEFGNASNAAFFGKGEGAKETLGELSI